MNVICLYEYTGLSAACWALDGYDVWCYDIQHKETQTIKYGKGRIHKVYWDAWSMEIPKHSNVAFVMGFPPCTDLAVSGASYFASKLEKDPLCQEKGLAQAILVEDVANFYNAPFFVENPVSILSTIWRKPNYYFNPFEYGGYLPEDDAHPMYPEYIPPRDAYTKKTCLWTGNGFIMPEKKEVPCVSSLLAFNLGGKSQKTKNIRSATPRGFAQAVYLANKRN